MELSGVDPVASAVDPQAAGHPDALRSLVPALCWSCLIAHAAFLRLFLITDVHLMVAVNVVSIAWYALAYALVRRARTKPIVAFGGVIAGEVVGHAFLATAVLVRLSPVNLTEAQVGTVAVALAGLAGLAGQPDAADGRVRLGKGWDVMGTVAPSVPSWSVWASKW